MKYLQAITSFSNALLLSTVVLPLAAFAAEGHGAAHHEGELADLFWFVVNFSIYVILLTWILRKPFLAAWTARRDELLELSTKGERELAAAEAELTRAQQRLSGLPAEIAAMERLIKGETARESEQILDESRKRAEIVLRQAQDTVASEDKAAQSGLRKEIVEKAVAKARAKIAKELTPEGDANLRRGVSTQVKGLLQ